MQAIVFKGRLSKTYDGWYVIPSAGYPRRTEKGFEEHQGIPVGVRACTTCEYVALFLPPTLDASGRPQRPGGASAP